MPAIEILGLEKTYMVGFWRKRPKRALQPLHLAVEEGEIFGFLGPNGAGKTTTLKMLMGLVFPTAGRARILEQDWTDPQVKAQIGFLPEQPYFYDYLTAHELLDYYGQLSGVPARDRKRRIEEVLARVGLTDVKGMQLRKFSKGMLQRAGIAQAILHDPKVIFLDEPMSGLDPVGRHEVRDIILDLKKQGRTVFFSTHILSDAEMLCDRVGVLSGGKLQGVGAPGEIVSIEVHAMEILFEARGDRPLPHELQDGATKIGGRYRVEVAEAGLYAALAQLESCDARILSVSPVRPTLEDYFLKLVRREQATPHEMEVTRL